MELGDYDGALDDFRAAEKLAGHNRRIENLIQKAAALQEKENNVDYYTLLGVKRTASEKELKEAYRKAVIKWHPDRHREPLKKKEAEKKMKMINKAYDVLSDDNKRKMYDMGHDPDGMPDQGQQPGGQNFNMGDFSGGTFHFPGGFGGGGFGGDFMNDILKQMMGGMGGMGGGGGRRTFTFQTRTTQQGKPGGSRQQNPRQQRKRM